MRSVVFRNSFFILALLFFSFLLNACGEAADTSGLSGSYVLQNIEEDGVILSEGLVADVGLTLRLDPGGTGAVLNSDSEGALRWKYELDRLSVTIGDVRLTGYLDGSDLFLQPDDEPVHLRFVPEDPEMPDETGSELADEAEIIPKAWSGNWYGWWKIEQSEGTLPVTWYDCCGSFAPQKDGSLRFTVWDEDGSRSEPLGEILFQETDDHQFSSLSGYFLYEKITAGEWILPQAGNELMLENFRHDANDERFTFTIYMRPWGAKWEDLAEEQRPFYYDDWYLIQVKKNQPMPDHIPWQDLERIRETPSD